MFLSTMKRGYAIYLEAINLSKKNLGMAFSYTTMPTESSEHKDSHLIVFGAAILHNASTLMVLFNSPRLITYEPDKCRRRQSKRQTE